MIDELNIPMDDIDEEILEKLREYFEPMDIEEDRKERRVNTAYQLLDVMLFFFTLCSTAVKYNRLERTYLLEQLKTRWLDVCENNVEIDDYISSYADHIVDDIVVVTMSHLSKEQEKEKQVEVEDSYWVSEDRALEIAENEANTLINYAELQEALLKGYTMKTWKTMRDRKVRDTHHMCEGDTIPIADTFYVGDCLMYMPHDYENGTAEEIVNCRCSLDFS